MLRWGPRAAVRLGAWWIAYHDDDAVAFAGVVPSTHARNSGYFCRVGVLQRHWGRGLQLRLMRAIEVRARRLGWDSIVSHTTDNPVPEAPGGVAYALLAKVAALNNWSGFPSCGTWLSRTRMAARQRAAFARSKMSFFAFRMKGARHLRSRRRRALSLLLQEIRRP
ncbi:GNAT family N-acetyltransferase [Bradyrhizobium sp. 62B]|nr:GNAT family N-acetyltransferase [Bradyrhizobium sp. 62B]